MDNTPSLQDQAKSFSVSDKRGDRNTIPAIDRNRVWIFVAVAYGFSIALGLAIYFSGGLFSRYPLEIAPSAVVLLQVLMFAPLVANIVTRLVTREGWSNSLLRPNIRRGWPFYLAAWFLPILATVAGGAIYYLLFPGRFDPSMTWARDAGLLGSSKDMAPEALFTTSVLMILVTAATMGLLLGFGEEFGWRGYLLPKLIPLGGRRAVLLVAVIHGIWHWPAILMGYEYGFGYWGEPVVGPLLFLVFALCLSAFLAWVTLRSGSVWPAALGHGAVNASPMLMFPFLIGDPDRLVGPIPVGIVGGLGYILLALLIFSSTWALAPIANTGPVEPKGALPRLQPTA